MVLLTVLCHLPVQTYLTSLVVDVIDVVEPSLDLALHLLGAALRLPRLGIFDSPTRL